MMFKSTIPIIFFLVAKHVFGACPEVSGSFFIELEGLYPESGDWDPETCKLYLSTQYNNSLVVYDPSARSSEVIPLPNLGPSNATYDEYHVDGVDYDASSGHIFVTATSATAFLSVLKDNNGQLESDYSHPNYTGPNRILIFDPKSKQFVGDVSLAQAQKEFKNKTGELTNGFQDMAEIQSTGDSYAIGTFGNSIARIKKGSNQAHLWYAPPRYNKTYGFGGIVSNGAQLIVSDAISGGLVTFNTTDSRPKATYVPLQGLPSNYRPLNADGLYLPQKYGGRVILWSDDFNGTSVYGSNDNWRTAHFLGLVPNDDPADLPGDSASDTFAIGDSLYVVTGFLQLTLPVQKKRHWPFYDITAPVDAFVRKSNITQSETVPE